MSDAAAWWDAIDLVPVGVLIDVQLRSAWERWVERLRLGPLRRMPGSFAAGRRA